MWWFLGALLVFLLVVGIIDFVQWRSGIRRIFPIVGHLRFLLIKAGPELRQYIVAGNREERPFNRLERDWIYHSADRKNNYFGFGTDDQIYAIGYRIIKHSVFGHPDAATRGNRPDQVAMIPSAKVIGETRGRARPYHPPSVVNVSAMSFGSLGAHAVEAINRGAKLAHCFHNTGEGGVSPHHRHGADLCWQIGTGYFGARTEDGRFDLERLVATVNEIPEIRLIEIKLSQGAKPGKGGILPAHKVTPEIARARGVEAGKDCVSPARHSAFGTVDELLDFVERVAERSGLPVGIKSAVGQLDFFADLAERMKATGTGPDFITIDGGEGGTGAAPLTFADHVSLPFKVALPRVYRIFAEAGLTDEMVWIGSGMLGFPDRAATAFALGADLINIAREAMLSIGCIQAQRCHTGFCPSGVATHHWWLQRGLVPTLAAKRFAAYIETFRGELLAVAHATGYGHPGEFTPFDIEVSAGPDTYIPLREVFGYDKKQYAPGRAPTFKPRRGAPPA